MIDASAAWQTFLAASKKSMDENAQFTSPHRGHSYKIIEVDTIGVKVKTEEATTARKPKIRIELFTNSMERINNSAGMLPKTRMCNGNVLFETVIVELLPMLSWDRGKHNIIETLVPAMIVSKSVTAKNIKETATREITVRRDQGKLRSELFKQYKSCCCISGCAIHELLYAAHITPYSMTFDNGSTNALLLKSDIHDLYGAYLLGIDPVTFKIEIASAIKSEYGHLGGVTLKGRIDKQVPDPEGMRMRWEEFKKMHKTQKN